MASCRWVLLPSSKTEGFVWDDFESLLVHDPNTESIVPHSTIHAWKNVVAHGAEILLEGSRSFDTYLPKHKMSLRDAVRKVYGNIDKLNEVVLLSGIDPDEKKEIK